MRKHWWQRCWSNYPTLTGLVSTTLGLTLLALGGWDSIDRSIYNTLFQLQARWHPLAWDQRVAIIAIDEASLARYGRFPWSRERYAELLQTLLPVQPAAIGFDLILTEATAEDIIFSDSIQLNSNVVLAVGDDGAGQALGITPTIAEPAAGTFLLGHVKVLTDVDGVSRRIQLYEGQFPSFGVALLQMYQANLEQTLGADIEVPPLPDTTAAVLDMPQRFNRAPRLLNWPGSLAPNPEQPGALTILSFAEVLEGQVNLSSLQNKIVLVGVTATGFDPLRTPLHTKIPTVGVFYHAAVVDNLLGNRFLHRWPIWTDLGLVLLFGMATSLLISRLGPKFRFALLLSMAPGWLLLAYGGLLNLLWLPIAAPVGTCLFSVLGLQFLEQKERQSLMNLLALNISPEMASLMWRNKADLLERGQIQPREMTVTVLFADIRGFTHIAESLPSEVLLPWLNRYFEVMTDCILTVGGVVDKYIGDAIMAVFGAPFPHLRPEDIQQDAVAAVQAGLAMEQRLQELNKEFAAAGLPEIRFGIGIHTGKVTAGTVGSRQRISYSFFGDTVNVAARLQDMTKTLTSGQANPILLSDETYRLTSEVFPCNLVGELRLRGRTTLSQIYTVKPLL